MFICIGEHSREVVSVGKGETIEAAIEDWARQIDEKTNQYAEFCEWKPNVFEAQRLNVRVNFNVQVMPQI